MKRSINSIKVTSSGFISSSLLGCCVKSPLLPFFNFLLSLG
jgi:hypothetical protein